MPLGVTVCAQHIHDAFLDNNLQKALLHGHSYTANPLACSSALASLDLLLKEECDLQRKMIEDCHKAFCRQWRGHPGLKRCESLGTILAVEYLTKEASSYFQPLRDRLYYFFLDRDILLRPLGNVVYVLPPYCIQREELHMIYEHIILSLEEIL